MLVFSSSPSFRLWTQFELSLFRIEPQVTKCDLAKAIVLYKNLKKRSAYPPKRGVVLGPTWTISTHLGPPYVWSALCLLLWKTVKLREEMPDRMKPALLWSDPFLVFSQKERKGRQSFFHAKTHPAIVLLIRAVIKMKSLMTTQEEKRWDGDLIDVNCLKGCNSFSHCRCPQADLPVLLTLS